MNTLHKFIRYGNGLGVITIAIFQAVLVKDAITTKAPLAVTAMLVAMTLASLRLAYLEYKLGKA